MCGRERFRFLHHRRHHGGHHNHGSCMKRNFGMNEHGCDRFSTMKGPDACHPHHHHDKEMHFEGHQHNKGGNFGRMRHNHRHDNEGSFCRMHHGREGNFGRGRMNHQHQHHGHHHGHHLGHHHGPHHGHGHGHCDNRKSNNHSENLHHHRRCLHDEINRPQNRRHSH